MAPRFFTKGSPSDLLLLPAEQLWYRFDPGILPIHPGDILAGYRVTRLLGRGGMGEVWAAAEPEGTKEVAIKVLLPRAALKPDLVARFEREAEVTAAIESDYVCKLLSTTRDESGSHLLVFEKLDGESLSERLKREIYLPFAEVGPIVADALEGLTAAHDLGVIHRDLKPGNIFLEWIDEPGRRERAKILDFGISKLTKKEAGRRDEPSLTDFDATLGSFAYMAPEQVRGAARVDERADIYAMGAVAFRALAGRLPFEGSNAGMIIALKLDRPAPSLSEVTGDQWPAGLERFLETVLQREPELRFPDATQALEEWRRILPMALTRRSTPPPVRGRGPVSYQTDTAIDGPPTMTEASDSVRWDTAESKTEVGDGFNGPD
ncbi:MAG: hypothetical protein DRI90_26210 [Deltaproteobacteria bacterium]|nr:MAG: hypothetical protein DRI90_26210 [Deltaproteobacteria bacterium]